jgi:hypothetical protein
VATSGADFSNFFPRDFFAEGYAEIFAPRKRLGFSAKINQLFEGSSSVISAEMCKKVCEKSAPADPPKAVETGPSLTVVPRQNF